MSISIGFSASSGDKKEIIAWRQNLIARRQNLIARRQNYAAIRQRSDPHPKSTRKKAFLYATALEKSGLCDMSHMSTSRTTTHYDKLRCTCSSKIKKRCFLKKIIPLNITNKNNFLENSSCILYERMTLNKNFLLYAKSEKLLTKCIGLNPLVLSATKHTISLNND